MKYQFFPTLILFFSLHTNIFAQETPCQVISEALKGTYTGDCIDGKANGKGIAAGKDNYDGEFKNGFPDGIGTYKWQNHEYYTGNWKKGLRQGVGEMHYITTKGDSTVKGFWKKDKYIGLYEKAYDVIATSSHVSKVDCSITNKKGKDINITVHQLAAFIATISNISVLTGTYYTKSNQTLSNYSTTRIQDVTFPFRAIFYLSNGESAEILFNESGDYDVYIDMR